ncbi:hydroxyacid dehydrogenase [Spartobacteria bacterium LR76]|nr:hydroxyacid dehydrogenase [Spartobacteria bacterium LR76]
MSPEALFQGTHDLLAAKAGGKIGRLLIAASPTELRQFFPYGLEPAFRKFSDEIILAETDRLTNQSWAQFLEEASPEVAVTCWSTPPLPHPHSESLRYVCHLAGSVRGLVSRQHIADGLLVTNWGNSISRTVAEWALFHILACLRKAGYWLPAMHRDGAWKPKVPDTCSLFGRRVGIHGFGSVARELTLLLQPFGVAISVLAPDVDDGLAAEYAIERARDLESLFAENDVVVELAPLIPETVGIVTEHHLRLMKPDSVFVNLGRAAIVDQEALMKVAREGELRIGLDVFAEEPLPASHQLRGLPNVVLTPHLGGPTTDRRCDAGRFALNNLARYASGIHPEAVITLEVFDTSS